MEGGIKDFYAPGSLVGHQIQYDDTRSQRISPGIVCEARVTLLSPGVGNNMDNLLMVCAGRVSEQVGNGYEPRLVRIVIPGQQNTEHEGSLMLIENNGFDHPDVTAGAIFNNVSVLQGTGGEVGQTLEQVIIPRLFSALTRLNGIINGDQQLAENPIPIRFRENQILRTVNPVSPKHLLAMCNAMLGKETKDRFSIEF
ncbi:hypothetical protein KC660_02465 [Candidatus Dojkabacteria bacterium]|uniref:Uncharacterized protein n=1 Tax=Candidatus Dojkabacteria bacterium TaxID=2099670 RepID=A0A955L3K2_9BACT|nr:hypothetical protein [Candidatus Dojkabacteria bacterium]